MFFIQVVRGRPGGPGYYWIRTGIRTRILTWTVTLTLTLNSSGIQIVLLDIKNEEHGASCGRWLRRRLDLSAF